MWGPAFLLAPLCCICTTAVQIYSLVLLSSSFLLHTSPPASSWSSPPPLEFFFQEQSYSSLHSGRSLAWDYVRGDIDDPCGPIADFCGVITDTCGVVAISEAISGRAIADAEMQIVARLGKHRKTLLNIVKHHETL